MQRIAQRIERAKGVDPTRSRGALRLTQPRVDDLLRGRLSRFSLDALVNVAAASGMRVELKTAD